MPDLNAFIARNLDTLTTLAEDMDFAVWINSAKGHILYGNQAIESLYGEKPENLLGKNVAILADNGLTSHQALPESLRTKKIATAAAISKNGYSLRLKSYPFLDENNKIYGLIGIGKPAGAPKGMSKPEPVEIPHIEPLEQLSKPFVVASEPMKKLLVSLPQIAQSEATVMISGESGVGKDGIAYRIHTLSSRADRPYIIINCATIPENLIESELFGYEKGAFTNATQTKIGLFELANHGTIFLDEVGEMPPAVQVKLLRCIQNRQIMRLGGRKMIDLNIRFITATNQSIEKMVKAGEFREDLFYRLNVIKLKIPPLRERLHDILPLAEQFLRNFNAKYKTSKILSRAAVRCIQGYAWPGNVRELENAIEHAVALCPDTIIAKEYLPSDVIDHVGDAGREHLMPLKQAVKECEKKLLLEAMRACSSTRKAARALGCNQATVVRKLKKYGLL